MSWLLNIAKAKTSLHLDGVFSSSVVTNFMASSTRQAAFDFFLEAGDMDGEMWFYRRLESQLILLSLFVLSCMFPLYCCKVDQA
jgi:hypothetical protein